MRNKWTKLNYLIDKQKRQKNILNRVPRKLIRFKTIFKNNVDVNTVVRNSC